MTGPTETHNADLYRWHLVAAIRDDHPLRGSTDEDGLLSVDSLIDQAVLVAPTGHASRSLLDRYTSALGLSIAQVSEDPAVLVALGLNSNRVPVIPSDSHVSYQNHWPRLHANGEALGGIYRVYWREDPNQPDRVRDLLRELAARIHAAAEPLRRLPGGSDGVRPWAAPSHLS